MLVQRWRDRAGRMIAGLGGAWFELEHTATGIDFGRGFGQRLDWLDESVGAIRALLDGKVVSSPAGGRYALDGMRLIPRPVQKRMPMMIGGSGEKKTLHTVAAYADMWNAAGSADVLRHKVEVLRRHCDDVGRDIDGIEFSVDCKPVIRATREAARRAWEAQMAHNRTPMARVIDDDSFWVGTPEQVAATMIECRALGFNTFIAEMPAPFDVETLERWIGEVRPMVDQA